ncbi:MAG: hypothetical protein ACFCD0_05460 [Gemmataceae bacterium]
MATESTQSTQQQQPEKPREVRIICHSGLFYWWPVWVVGLVMALITFLNAHQVVAVPYGAKLQEDTVVEKVDGESKFVRKLVLETTEEAEAVQKPTVRMSTDGKLGVFFCVVLLLVIVITNIPMRGLWSVIVILVIISLVVILTAFQVWDAIIENLSLLDIRISFGGYLITSLVLMGIWLVVFLLFDRRFYMIFTPGSFRVHLEIGEGETAYDTRGMTLQKVRSDFFRHWILGLGSGDLVVKTSGAHSHQFDLHNVLFVDYKVKVIEELLRTQVVSSNDQ